VTKLEERLRKELDRSIVPTDPTEVVERVAARHRRRARRRPVGIALLTIAVVAGTLLGTYALIRAFRPGTGPEPAAAGEGRILFSGRLPDPGAEYSLFTVDVATGEIRMVPGSDVGWPETPEWSPDGSMIAFTREKTGGILVMDANGTSVRRLTDSGTDPTWSPDGSMLAFMDDDGIWTVDVDGITQTWIAKGGWPAWSPDGSTIVFSGPEGLLVKDPDPDTEPTPLGVEGNRPDWAPDGSMIAFSRDDGIYVVHADGTSVRELTTARGFYLDPSWSPDSSMIAFAYDARHSADCTESGCPHKFEVWVMNADGSDARQLTHLTTNQYLNSGTSPDWLPVPIEQAALEEEPQLKTDEPVSSPHDASTVLGAACSVSTVEGDFDGDGLGETAYGLYALLEGETCEDIGLDPKRFTVAVDMGDGLLVHDVELCEEGCRVFAAPDIDGDGSDELLVVHLNFSILRLGLYDVSDDGTLISAATVAPPGDPAGGFEPGEMAEFWLGGDGFSWVSLRCDNRHEGRVLVATLAHQDPPDSPDAVWKAHETTLWLVPDELQVLSTRDFEEPVTTGPGASPSFATGEGLCGARLEF